MTNLFSSGPRVAVKHLVARGARVGRPQLACLIAIAAGQQLLFAYMPGGISREAALQASGVLLIASFLALAWAGGSLVRRAGFRTVGAMVAGALFNAGAQAVGLAVSAVAGNPPDLQSTVASVFVGAALGSVFAGVGAVAARINGLHWLK